MIYALCYLAGFVTPFVALWLLWRGLIIADRILEG